MASQRDRWEGDDVGLGADAFDNAGIDLPVVFLPARGLVVGVEVHDGRACMGGFERLLHDGIDGVRRRWLQIRAPPAVQCDLDPRRLRRHVGSPAPEVDGAGSAKDAPYRPGPRGGPAMNRSTDFAEVFGRLAREDRSEETTHLGGVNVCLVRVKGGGEGAVGPPCHDDRDRRSVEWRLAGEVTRRRPATCPQPVLHSARSVARMPRSAARYRSATAARRPERFAGRSRVRR